MANCFVLLALEFTGHALLVDDVEDVTTRPGRGDLHVARLIGLQLLRPLVWRADQNLRLRERLLLEEDAQRARVCRVR